MIGKMWKYGTLLKNLWKVWDFTLFGMKTFENGICGMKNPFYGIGFLELVS